MKKASLIVVNYNDKVRVGRAILSCINQTWENVEVIVVDDGSDEATKSIYKEFGDKIKLIERPRTDFKMRTVPHALNAGLDAATGDYVAVLGSDDYFDSKYVEILIKMNADIAVCNWRTVGLQTQEIAIHKHWDLKDHPLKNYLLYNMLSHECMLCTKEVVESVGKYDERLPRSQDCDWIVRACLKDFNWMHNKRVLVNVEKHEVDQQKNYASIHGKTLWSLKNNVNIRWLLSYMKNGDVMGMLSMYQGIYDFIYRPEWALDYRRSEFREFYDEFEKILKAERNE